MALQQIERSMSDALDKILKAAAKILTEAHVSYREGMVSAVQLQAVTDIRSDLCQILARCSDGIGYIADDDYHAAAVDMMRSYEEMADSWLRAVYAESGELPTDSWTRTPAGDYVVTRQRQTAQGMVYRRTTARNPAVAIRDFDEAEDERAA